MYINFRKSFLASLIVSLLTVISAPISSAQSGGNYLHLTYRAVQPDREQGFLLNMTNIIKPLFEAEISAGRLQGWYLWRARYKSEHAMYNYIIVRLSSNLADHEYAFEGGIEAASARVFSDRSWSEINDELQRSASTIVKTALVQASTLSLVPSAIPGTWANIMFYRNHDRTNGGRDLLLREFMNPFQQGRIDHGISAGWAYYIQWLPIDDSESSNVTEVEYYDEFDQILGAGIAPTIWDSVKTDNSNFIDNIRRLNETRDFVKREVWELIDYAVAD